MKNNENGNAITKPVSFTAKESKLVEYAKQQGGFSYYVKRLIREDMERKQGTNVDMSSILASLFTNGNLNVNNQNNIPTHDEPSEETGKKTVNKRAISNIINSVK